jgi:hypothetical protein
MQSEDLQTWEEFEEKIREIDEETKTLKNKSVCSVSPPLFRGQPDAIWTQDGIKKLGLETILEREVRPQKMSLGEYLKIAICTQKIIESYTGKNWDISNEIETYWKKPPDDFQFFWWRVLLNTVEFMVYLRHCGFPSPLLDWTVSPYVAAFFAFEEKCKTDKVAIWMYREDVGHGKEGGSLRQPYICSIGPTLRTHSRHYLQQAEYTFCVKDNDIPNGSKEHLFCPHEDVKPPESEGEKLQDIIVKFTLPATEREKVLKKLKTMNITAYSLFGTEDALVRSLGMKFFLLE